VRAWYRKGDERWQERFKNEWSEERRKKMIDRGVTSRAQHWTVGHYTEEFTRGESEGVMRNIRKAGFRLSESTRQRS
jgi:hypothetical protein